MGFFVFGMLGFGLSIWLLFILKWVVRSFVGIVFVLFILLFIFVVVLVIYMLWGVGL